MSHRDSDLNGFLEIENACLEAGKVFVQSGLIVLYLFRKIIDRIEGSFLFFVFSWHVLLEPSSVSGHVFCLRWFVFSFALILCLLFVSWKRFSLVRLHVHGGDVRVLSIFFFRFLFFLFQLVFFVSGVESW